MATRLNTTDFSILGLLSRRPWSAYEMTQYMRFSNIRAVWPRAESRIYESPKKLAAMGFATAAPEKQGKRTRVVYHITAEGSVALSQWLEEEGKSFSFEYEALLKLTLGDISDPEHQWAHLDHLAQQAQQDWDQLADWFALFAQQEESDISADRRAQNLLVNGFIKELLEARLRWSGFARKFEQKFEKCQSEAEKDELVALYYRKMMEES
jgi:PadR family transcriptional regulator AphA